MATMTEKFVDTETDRTKSKWVAKVFRAFCRPRTTIRALYYYAMTREDTDYPICGGFVGEIRIVRRYHESDGEKLPKWAGRARQLGFIPEDAIIDELPGEHIFPPSQSQGAIGTHSGSRLDRPNNVELWLNKSALVPLMLPACRKHGVTLVSIEDHPSKDALEKLFARARTSPHPTLLLCLSDLSMNGINFCRDLARKIADFGSSMPATAEKPDIRLRRMGLTPGQVADLKISMAPGQKAEKHEKEAFARYKSYLKPYGQNPKLQAELDALEVYYPGGIAKFIDDRLSEYDGGSGQEGQWLLDLKAGMVPGEKDIDFSVDNESA
ncbi:MAG TPA: hypothetical protein VN455_12365 [Methanotrichaceae archaeon]|nr:hypothetical protein [Methanotrichaceae archaeon]